MKIDRLVSIILLLLNKERVGAQELAEMFEVSQRTIYRDMEVINAAGIPIFSVPGVSGGFEIMPKYKIDKKVFSSSDLTAILMGLSNVSLVIKGEELINALAKVKSFIPKEKAKDIEIKANQVFIDLSSWMGQGDTQLNLEAIKLALQESKKLSFDYLGHSGDKSLRIVEPYQLVFKSSNWYMQSYCYRRNDFRLFKLSRISNIQVLEDCFIKRDFPKPQLDFNDVISSMQKLIKIRIHKSILERVLDYCSFDHFIQEGENHFIVNFPFIENDYHYNILLSFGEKCECLEPKNIREEMKRKAKEILSLYER